jgi:hypothetical protein
LEVNVNNTSRVGLGAVLVLALLGCNTPPAGTQGPHLGMNPTIVGTLVGYTGGAGKVEIEAPPFFANAGTIAANGAFGVTLPSSGFPLFAVSSFANNCVAGSGSISVIPNDAKYSFVDARTPDGGYFSQNEPSQLGVGAVNLVRKRLFVDKDVVISGSCTKKSFGGSTSVDTYSNISLKAGWNEVTFKLTTTASPENDSEMLLGIPGNQPWRAIGGSF